MYMCYEVGREPRENHPNQEKAVLYLVKDGRKEKVNVWKPGYDSPKVPIGSVPGITTEIWKEFEAEKNKIAEEEKILGLADW